MQKQLLKISKAQTSNLMERLKNPANLDECLAEVKKMLVIKQRLALDSEVACWATSPEAIRAMAERLDEQIQLLYKAVESLEKGDLHTSSSLLNEYRELLQY